MEGEGEGVGEEPHLHTPHAQLEDVGEEGGGAEVEEEGVEEAEEGYGEEGEEEGVPGGGAVEGGPGEGRQGGQGQLHHHQGEGGGGAVEGRGGQWREEEEMQWKEECCEVQGREQQGRLWDTACRFFGGVRKALVSGGEATAMVTRQHSETLHRTRVASTRRIKAPEDVGSELMVLTAAGTV